MSSVVVYIGGGEGGRGGDGGECVFKSVTNSFQETLHVVWEEVLFCSFD